MKTFLWFQTAERIGEVFDGEIGVRPVKLVGDGAVLPHGEPQGHRGIPIQLRLREERGEIARQHIAAAALGEMRIAG